MEEEALEEEKEKGTRRVDKGEELEEDEEEEEE